MKRVNESVEGGEDEPSVEEVEEPMVDMTLARVGRVWKKITASKEFGGTR